DGHGDRPRPLPVIKELKRATNITDRKESPSWDYDEEDSCWKWKKPPPTTTTTAAAAVSCTTITEKPVQTETSEDLERAWKKAQNKYDRNQLLNALKCQLCREVMNSPLTTPCAHNFCKPCLKSVFAGKSSVRKRYFCQGRSLRAQKSIMKCPSCPMDLSEFLQNPQVNRELMAVIEDLQRQAEEENDEDSSEETWVSDKPENMIGVAKDGSDNSNMLDDSLEIEGEPKQMNKRLKTKGSASSANAEKSEFKSNKFLEEMKLHVTEDLQIRAGKENDEDPSDGTEGFDRPENMIGVAKDGSDNSDMSDDVVEIEGEFKRMNKRMKTKGSDFSGNAEKSECKSIEAVDKMKLDVADGGNVVTKDAVKEVVKTSRTFTAEPKPKRGSGGDCLPKPEPNKRGCQKKTKEIAVAVVADEGNDSPSSPLQICKDDNRDSILFMRD
ncbi:hypothetical protein MKW92_010247, partial [Papaver armeniacum]